MKIEFRIEKTLLDVAPHPVPSKKIIPDWYKKMSSFVDDNNPRPTTFRGDGFNSNLTIKRCVPVRDVLTSGYYLLTSNDIVIEKRGADLDSQWSRAGSTTISSHSSGQFNGSHLTEKAIDNNVILKFNVPWRIYTEKGSSCYFTHPEYLDLPFTTLSGIVDTDKMHEINFPFCVDMKDDEPILIEKGTPIVHILPFMRRDWVSSVAEHKPEDGRKHYSDFYSVFSGWYRRFAHSKKRYD